jgi:hypothetical protein
MRVGGKDLGSDHFDFAAAALAKYGESDGFGMGAEVDFAGDGSEELECAARILCEGDDNVFKARFEVLDGLADGLGEGALGEFVGGGDMGEVGNAIVEHCELSGVLG